MKLRDYQEEALAALYKYWEKGELRHPVLLLPTGAGKSLLIAYLCAEAAKYPGCRVLVVTHRAELVRQDFDEMQEIIPDVSAGIFCAGLKEKNLGETITFATVASIINQLDILPKYEVVIIDEAHLIPPNANTRYRKLLGSIAEVNPEVVFVALTATPYRMDSGLIYGEEDSLFDGLAHEVTVRRLLDGGYLAPLVSRSGCKKIDLSKVRRDSRTRDYIAGDLQEAAMCEGMTEAIVADALKHGHDRKSWLVFSSGVDHAWELAEAFTAAGITTEVVLANTKNRKEKLDAFKAGKVRCLIGADVLTTGFNCPRVDLLIFARATESTSLYVQIMGRGSRTFPGKENCLVLDYGGNVERHGFFDNVRVPYAKGKGEGEPVDAPVKECPLCNLHVHASVRNCECGHEFPAPRRGSNLSATSFSGRLIGPGEKPEWWPVDSVSMKRWSKPGSNPSICVTYKSGFLSIKEWVCPEHTGFARRKYEQWAKSLGIPTFDTVSDALQHPPAVHAILIRRKGKYEEVLSRLSAQDEEEASASL
jgi:DNA repair protein RadD